MREATTEDTKKSNNRVLLVLFLGVLMGALDIAIVGPALPAIGKSFDVDERGLAWVFNIFVLCSLVSSPLMAKLSDRYGRRALYLADISLFWVGSLLVALSPNFAVLLLGRAIQGLGAGGLFPVAGAVIGDTFPEEKRGRALGLIGAVFGIAFIIGPVVGGLLLLLSWHWLFLVNLPLGLLIFALGYNTLPHAVHTGRQPFDYAGVALLVIWLGSLAFGISQVNASDLLGSLSTPLVWPFLLVGLVTLPVFVRLERRAADPVIHPGLFGSRQLKLTNAIAIGAGIGESAVVFMPGLAVAAFGMSESNASFLLLTLVFAMAFGSPLAGRMLDQVGPRAVLVAGSVIFGLGSLVLGVLGNIFWFYVLAAVLIGLGLGCLLGAPLRYIMLDEATGELRSAAQSLVTVTTGIGQLAGGALLGALAASQAGTGGYTLAYIVVGLLGLVMIGLALGLKKRLKAYREEAVPV